MIDCGSLSAVSLPGESLTGICGVADLNSLRNKNNLHLLRISPWMAFRIFVLVMLLSACSLGTPEKTPTATSAVTGIPLPTATLVATSTPTPLPPAVLLVVPPQADAALAAKVQSSLERLSSQSGMRLLVQPALSTQELTPDVKIVAALSPLDGLESLASSNTSIQFIALGFADLKPAINLSLIDTSSRPDQLGFLAGAIAAILTEDWRVGAITLSDTPSGKAAGLGFQNGVVYFCGLCRPNDPPFVEYPVVVQLPSQASQTDWQAGVQSLVSKSVKTVYVFPGAGDEAMLAALDEAGMHIIGGASPTSSLQAVWIASLQADLLPSLENAWPQIVTGKGSLQLQSDLVITDINADLFSPGRQDLVKKIMADLLSGAIDTRVDPQTGEAR
jgi:hypothetical protein